MKSKPKVLHPNKLVQQHDEYLIDKSLVNRVKSAKPTIKNSNTFFENRLKSFIFSRKTLKIKKITKIFNLLFKKAEIKVVQTLQV